MENGCQVACGGFGIREFLGAAAVMVVFDEGSGFGEFGLVVEEAGAVEVDLGEVERHGTAPGDLPDPVQSAAGSWPRASTGPDKRAFIVLGVSLLIGGVICRAMFRDKGRGFLGEGGGRRGVAGGIAMRHQAGVFGVDPARLGSIGRGVFHSDALDDRRPVEDGDSGRHGAGFDEAIGNVGWME